MNMMIFNAICKRFQKGRNVKKCTAFQTGGIPIPMFLCFPIGEIDRMLQMKQHGTNDNTEIVANKEGGGRKPIHEKKTDAFGKNIVGALSYANKIEEKGAEYP
jgi:hypothetical protein